MVETCDLNSLQAVQDFGDHPLYYICCIFATVVGAIAGATASSRVRMDIVGVLACVLKDAEQPPWLLPTRCQGQPLLNCNGPTSRHFQKYPGSRGDTKITPV